MNKSPGNGKTEKVHHKGLTNRGSKRGSERFNRSSFNKHKRPNDAHRGPIYLCCDMFTIYGTLLTNIMSTRSISFEMFILLMSTCTFFFVQSFLQCLGKRYASAANMSNFVTGQFVRRLFSIRWMKSFVLVLPIISWFLCANVIIIHNSCICIKKKISFIKSAK